MNAVAVLYCVRLLRYQGMSGAVLSGGRAIPTSSWEHYRVVSTEPNNVAGGYTEHGTFNIKDYHHHHNNEDDERSAMENELNPSSTAGGNNRDVPKTHHVVRRQVVAQEVNIMKVKAGVRVFHCSFTTILCV